MSVLRIEQALARAKERGIVIKKKELAAMLWPESVEVTQIVNMTKLCSGRTKRVPPEWIRIICNATGVSADFLLGLINQ